MRVKHWSDLNAAEERKKDIEPDDPSDGAFVIILELMLTEILVEDTHSVPILLLTLCLTRQCQEVLTSSQTRR